ncbi:hypothetical protein BDV96DRAFT_590704 [Lophiotrema nucula]|uniref:Uncharacterized protein n=1 Tax=Lophiotrema nucula TaxID=690887 RepID=A0A6A5YHY8_9PLEO|nr:hypothetical protein BDV96DRAFT_590704 [Lophiotrema nucula]
MIYGIRSDDGGKKPVLTNFLESSQLTNGWADIICKNITDVPSNQYAPMGDWHYTIQGSHKKGQDLVHSGRFLYMQVTWRPSDTDILPLFDGMKVDLCKGAMNAASNNYNTQWYQFDMSVAFSVKNYHEIAISTPIEGNGYSKTIASLTMVLSDDDGTADKRWNGNGQP